MNKMAYSNSMPCAKEILVVLTHGLVYGVFEYLCHNGGGAVVFVVAPAVHEMASIHGKYIVAKCITDEQRKATSKTKLGHELSLSSVHNGKSNNNEAANHTKWEKYRPKAQWKQLGMKLNYGRHGVFLIYYSSYLDLFALYGCSSTPYVTLSISSEETQIVFYAGGCNLYK